MSIMSYMSMSTRKSVNHDRCAILILVHTNFSVYLCTYEYSYKTRIHLKRTIRSLGFCGKSPFRVRVRVRVRVHPRLLVHQQKAHSFIEAQEANTFTLLLREKPLSCSCSCSPHARILRTKGADVAAYFCICFISQWGRSEPHATEFPGRRVFQVH